MKIYDSIKQLAEDVSALATFVFKSVKNDPSHVIKIHDLMTKSKELLKLLEANRRQFNVVETSFVEDHVLGDQFEYLAGSQVSASNKGMAVLSKLNDLGIDLENYGFVSVGGGDGSELYTELAMSKANYGLLLEYNWESIDRFAQRFIPFKLANYERYEDLYLDRIECDVFDMDKLNVAKSLIKAQNLDGIVVSIHAVLHELSMRSKLKKVFQNDDGTLDFEKFFRIIYEWHENIILIVREPGIAENWPKEVHIRVGESHRKDFKLILTQVQRAHFSGDAEVTNSWLEEQQIFIVSKDLAIESLTKLFYKEDFEYEIGEKITSVSRNVIANALNASERLYKIHESQPFFTDSFKKNMLHFGVEVSASGLPTVSFPSCFTYTIATKLKSSL